MGTFVLVNDAIDNEEVVSDASARSSADVGVTHEGIDDVILVIEQHSHMKTSEHVNKEDSPVVFDVLQLSFSRFWY